MRTNYKTGVIVLLVVLAAFAAALAQLFAMRFEAGDIYPPYSSLRADPVGVKAFYESLGNLPGMDVNRNYEDESRIDTRKAAFFYFGVSLQMLHFLPRRDVETLENIAAGGGRIVICLYPQANAGLRNRPKAKDAAAAEKQEAVPSDTKQKEDAAAAPVDLASRWGVNVAVWEAVSPAAQAVPAPSYFGMPLRDPISWHSSAYFMPADGAWIPVYEVDGRAVILERKYGRGSLVLATDSYFVSNEAMVKERHPDLLAWLSGPCKKIVFDEAHLGLAENKGLIYLFKKYHLQGLLIVLGILGILFIWKNSYSLVPAEAAGANGKEEEAATGKDSLSGFVGMLRRTITPARLLSVCLAEWEKTAQAGRVTTTGKREKIQALIKERKSRGRQESGIVAIYNEVSKILAERKLS